MTALNGFGISSTVCFLALTTHLALAQGPGEGGNPEGRRQPGGGPRMFPLMRALDTNGDGELSAEEMAKASESLKALDKN